ncbi:MAG: hypothetical protein IJP68_05550 [Selenomonadaceae bacterium]|nr:hypothetical protein [Selenomonadaceae bacterium]
MKPILTLYNLIGEVKNFCEMMSERNHINLIGVTDGKAVGTYVEHEFKNYLCERYILTVGNSAKGIDLPDEHILTDIKVTSITQPQSSCPFESTRQKIFGLGYNLLILVYDKRDSANSCTLKFIHCVFIDKQRTADFTITKRLREMLSDGANKEDIIGFLRDKNLPGDEITYNNLATEILYNMPLQGYLTISNALQCRLQYSRAISLSNAIEEVTNYDWQT